MTHTATMSARTMARDHRKQPAVAVAGVAEDVAQEPDERLVRARVARVEVPLRVLARERIVVVQPGELQLRRVRVLRARVVPVLGRDDGLLEEHARVRRDVHERERGRERAPRAPHLRGGRVRPRDRLRRDPVLQLRAGAVRLARARVEEPEDERGRRAGRAVVREDGEVVGARPVRGRSAGEVCVRERRVEQPLASEERGMRNVHVVIMLRGLVSERRVRKDGTHVAVRRRERDLALHRRRENAVKVVCRVLLTARRSAEYMRGRSTLRTKCSHP
jgi:hypothetical protein